MIRPLLCQLYFRHMFLVWFNIYFSLISVPVLDSLFQYRFVFLSFHPSLLVLLFFPLLSNSFVTP
ncbi:hypothetical protein HanRHA438_Chr16g0753931 [Helianthus annuus]|nr:hypothetical protein HanRHA438_Chr16g0753931 [Helianthus annuus]